MSTKIILFSKITSQRSYFSTTPIVRGGYSKKSNFSWSDFYKHSLVLKPIISIENELLTPIELRSSDIKKVKMMEHILYSLSDSSLVKIWLNTEFKDKIIINAVKNENIDELLKDIKKIKRNDFSHRSEKSLFTFKDSNELVELMEKNSLHTCCYIITFESNNSYFYIGSTTDLQSRFKTHSKNINNYIEGKKSDLNLNTQKFLDSEIHHLQSVSGEQTLNFQIKIIYLGINYVNSFIKAHPDYKLNKKEFILLCMITDFIIKILEYSLIKEFKPKLNMTNKVTFKFFEWEDEF